MTPVDPDFAGGMGRSRARKLATGRDNRHDPRVQMSPTIDEQEAGRDQPQSERRRRRSLDPITALHYQLAATRQSGSLQAVVLVDDSGCLVAGAGAWPLCEELAAYAPLFSEPRERLRTMVSMRVADLSLECESRMLSIDGQSVFLCARGSSDVRADALSRAAAGVRRILLAA